MEILTWACLAVAAYTLWVSSLNCRETAKLLREAEALYRDVQKLDKRSACSPGD